MASKAEIQIGVPTATISFPEGSLQHDVLAQFSYGFVAKLICASLIAVSCCLSVRKHRAQGQPRLNASTYVWRHIVGLRKFGVWYFPTLRTLPDQNFYTISFLWYRVHIAMTDEIIASIHRDSKNFSFRPFAIGTMTKLLGLPISINTVLVDKMHGNGYMQAEKEILWDSLRPGTALKNMLDCGGKELSRAMGEEVPLKASLRTWTEELVVRVGAVTFWGPDNPFAIDPSLIQTNNFFAENFHAILLSPFPRWTASKAIAAREKVFQAFCGYYLNSSIDKALPLMQKRVQNNKEHGLSLEDCARLDLPIVEAVFANTIPLALWMLHYIYTDKVLLDEIRAEVQQLLDGNTMRWKGFQQKCPLLVSTWYEVCRITVALPSNRTVLNDVVLKDQYLLRKNDHIIISPGIIHANRSVWGSGLSFNPRRFLTENHLSEGKDNLRSSVRISGGGKHLCPGRHFAFNEILMIVATSILKFHISPADGRKWEVPAMSIRTPSLGVQLPVADLQVVLTPRTEFKNKEIDYDFEEM